MEIRKSVRLNFEDEKKNKKSISLSNPKNDLTSGETDTFGNLVVEKNLIKGKSGFLNKYNGAVIVKVSEEALV